MESHNSSLSELGLGTLYRDLLRPILALLDGLSIARLWICGNKTLIDALEDCTEQFIVVYSPKRASFSWPTLLRRFPNLHRFSAYVPEFMSRYPIKGVDLEALPPGIRRLDLVFANAALELAKALSPASSGVHTPLTASQPHSIANLFPKLTSVIVENAYELPQLIKPDFVNCQLQRISLPSIFSLTYQEVSLLPTTCQILDIALKWTPAVAALAAKEGVVSFFPPALSALRIHLTRSFEWIKYLPADLTELHMGKPAAMIAQLNDVAALPRKLRVLRARFFSLDSSMFQALPSTLIIFSMEASVPVVWDSMPKWPCQNLVNFHSVHTPVNLSYPALLRMIKDLPRTLETMPQLTDHVAPIWGELPRSLKSITMQSTWIGNGNPDATLKQLPPHLTRAKLQLASHMAQTLWKGITSQQLLKHLQVTFDRNNFVPSKHLPTFLLASSSSSYAETGDIRSSSGNVYPLSLPHLTTLALIATECEIRRHPGSTEQETKTAETLESQFLTDWVCSLPHQLTSLLLRMSASKEGERRSRRQNKKGVDTLGANSISIFSSALSSLPCSLTELLLSPVQTCSPRDIFSDNMPPNLTQLELRGPFQISLSVDDVLRLPRYLLALRLPFSSESYFIDGSPLESDTQAKARHEQFIQSTRVKLVCRDSESNRILTRPCFFPLDSELEHEMKTWV